MPETVCVAELSRMRTPTPTGNHGDLGRMRAVGVNLMASACVRQTSQNTQQSTAASDTTRTLVP